jgi:PAS domain S-box-containing protein
MTKEPSYEELLEKVEELERLNKVLNLVNEHTKNVYFRTDHKGRITYVSPGIEHLLGYSEQEAVGMSLTDAFFASSKDRKLFNSSLKKDNKAVNLEVLLKRKDGSTWWGEINARCEKDKKGKITEIWGTACAIDDLKKTEEALRKASRFTQQVIGAASDGIIVFDENDLPMIWNHRMEEMSGFSAEEVIGIHPLEKFPFLKEQGIWGYYERAKAGETVTLPDHKFHAAGVKEHWESVTYSPLKDEDGVVNGVLAVVRDITLRKEKEEALEQTSRFFKQVIDLVTDGILALDAQDRYSIWNKRMEENSGISSEEVIGEHPLELFPFIREQGLWDLFERAKAGETVVTPEHPYVVEQTGKTGWEYLTCSPVTSETDEVIGVLVVMHDVTVHKQAQEALEGERKFLRQVIDAVPGFIWVRSEDGRLVLTNQALLDAYGSAGAELDGQVDPVLTSLPDELVGLTQDDQKGIEAGETNVTAEEKIIGIDGTERWFVTTKIPLEKADGDDDQLLVVAMDITDRKRAEQELRASEQRLKALFENSPVSLWEEDASEVRKYLDKLKLSGVSDLSAHFEAHPEALQHCAKLFKILRVNQTTLDLYGATGLEDFHQGLSAILTDAAWETFTEELVALNAGETRFIGETVQKTLQGDNLDVILQISIPPGYEDTWERLYVSIVDITERKKVDRQLELINQAIGNSLNGFDIVDEEGKLIYVNQAYVDMWGYDSEDEILETSPVSHCADPDIPLRIISELKENGSITIEYKGKRKDGSLFDVLMYAYLDHDLDGKEIYCGTSLDITDRKRAEEERREISERFQTVFQYAPLGIAIAAPDGRFLEVNDYLLEALGYSLEEIRELTFLEITHPDDQSESKRLSDAVQSRAADFYEVEKRYLKKDGGVLWIRLRATALRKVDHSIKYWFGIIEDITEKKQVAEALQESEEKFRLAFENAIIGRGIARPDGPFSKVNKAFADMLGMTQEELETKSWTDITHPDFMEVSYQLVRDLVENKVQGATIEIIMLHKEGRSIWTRLTCTLTRDAEGIPLHLIGDIEDITDRRQVEEALQQNELYLRTVLSSMPVILWVVDSDGTIILSTGEGKNAESYKNVQREWGDLGQSIFDLYRDVPGVIMNIRQALAGESLTMVYEVEGRVYESRLTPLLDSDGKVDGVVGATVDVTEQRQAEEEIRKLNAELEQRVEARTAQLEAANKELEAFSYSVSHDLRAPLRAIDGFSGILADDYAQDLSEEVKRYLNLIQKNAQQMGMLIDDLLSFSRLSRQPINKQLINTADLVQQVLETLESETKDREVEITIGELPDCQGDPILIKQVWINLLSNAVKFTLDREVAKIEIGCDEGEGERKYFVKDNGVGFDMKYAGKLFGVFQRLHSASEFEGTGVGLATVQRIVHRHGGRIWAEAELQSGASFYFTL